MAKVDKVVQRPLIQAKKPDVSTNRVVAKKTAQPAAKTSFEDILKAMLQVPEPVPVEENKSEVEAYYEEAMRKSEMMKTEKKSLIPASVKYRPEKTTVKKSPSYKEAIKIIDEKHSSQKAINIKENLSNPQAIRDYIVMNEILGKPIALRE